MKLGVAMFATDYAIRPDDLARACEERDFESVWFPEHIHIPLAGKDKILPLLNKSVTMIAKVA